MAVKRDPRAGLSLLDVMIVVAIIGLLSGIAIPSVQKSRKSARDMKFVSDIRTAVQSFEQYSMLNATYPADQVPGVPPPEMAGYLPRMDWTARTSIGGLWDWDYQRFGVKAGVSVYRPDRTDDDMAKIDKRFDDGSLASGMFRQRSEGYIYVIEQ
ncbi:MAG: hypothetical protein FJ224_03210 [Lentisphaerae bacterium]|nr:hypothetical protein [Lentisphaerota bacterium]